MSPLPHDLSLVLRPRGILLVPPRMLRRVVKRRHHIAGVEVPHTESYSLPTHELAPLVDDLDLHGLGPSVILIALPEASDPTPLLTVWRNTFHALLHQQLARLPLSPAELRAHVHRIGQVEFDEIRAVLRQDCRLLPPGDALETYTEFAATYLELAAFVPASLEQTFPSLADHHGVDQLLACNLDLAQLLEQSRPPGAPALPPPPAAERKTHGEAHPRVFPQSLRPIEGHAPVVANVLLALSQHTRRGEVDAARGILATLARRIAAALAWPEAPLETWTDALSLLIARLRLPWSAPARLVYDLQKACLDHEREVFTIDVVGWIASLGTRPVRRPLPAQRLVRIVRSLRSAHQRLEGRNMAGLAKTPLDELLSSWVQRAEENLRAALRPRIVEALGRAGLLPDNVPETVARNKLVEELLDQAVAKGFLSLGSLRDAIARNDLKMPNLSGPRQWLVGDALLAADGELAVTLDGVYRQGELYLRGLQKVSSLFFGTRGGRWLTLYVILPLLGSFVILEGMQHLVGPLLHHALHRRVHLFTPVPFLLLAAYLFGLLHAEPVRRGTLRVARAVGATLRAVFVRLPVWLVTRPLVLRIARSAPVLFLWRYALKPLVWVTPWIALGKHQHWGPIPLAVGACVGFVLANVASNSKLGIRLEEAAFDLAARSWRNVTGHLLPGLVRYVLDLFQRLVDTIERGIYAVDERLRFRSGESVVAIYAKGLIGVVWFLATYLLRIYVNLLVEPQVNPVKHFPVVTVGHKLTLPMAPMLVEGLNGVLRVVLGPVVGGIMAGVTVLLLPGLFGFLAWELKENYRLYRQNRPKELGPILIGSHGETMLRLLRPGFHSGTLPKAYGKLRRAERRGAPSLLAREHALGHVEEAVRHFIERELVALLVASGHFGQLVVGPINLASNRIRVALECGEAGGAAVLAFEEQSGWILGSLTTLGFVEHLSAGERVVFETALAGLFKKAAVDIVREQLEAQLRGEHGIPAYDIADEGLVVWPDADLATEVVYALDGRNELQPTVREAQDTKGARTLQRNAVLYRETPLSWERWVGAWRGAGGIRVLSEPGT